MTLGEFREQFKDKEIRIRDMAGNDITYKPRIISDLFTVIGSEHHPDNTIIVDVFYYD